MVAVALDLHDVGGDGAVDGQHLVLHRLLLRVGRRFRRRRIGGGGARRRCRVGVGRTGLAVAVPVDRAAAGCRNRCVDLGFDVGAFQRHHLDIAGGAGDGCVLDRGVGAAAHVVHDDQAADRLGGRRRQVEILQQDRRFRRFLPEAEIREIRVREVEALPARIVTHVDVDAAGIATDTGPGGIGIEVFRAVGDRRHQRLEIDDAVFAIVLVDRTAFLVARRFELHHVAGLDRELRRRQHLVEIDDDVAGIVVGEPDAITELDVADLGAPAGIRLRVVVGIVEIVQRLLDDGCAAIAADRGVRNQLRIGVDARPNRWR